MARFVTQPQHRTCRSCWRKPCLRQPDPPRRARETDRPPRAGVRDALEAAGAGSICMVLTDLTELETSAGRSRPAPHQKDLQVQIVQREQAEEASAERPDLARSNEDLQQFAIFASHDLQEPLRMVRGFLDLLQERYAPQLDEKAREYIAFAADARHG